MRGFWASNYFRNAVKPWLCNWFNVGSFGIPGGVSMSLIHQLVTTPCFPTLYCHPLPPSPALWKATRAHVRPCSCWALVWGAPVEQQWGGVPRHSTTNGHSRHVIAPPLVEGCGHTTMTSGKGGLALKLPRAAWVSQKTVKISKTQSALGSHRSKSTWNSIFKDSQSNFKALPKTPRYTQSSPRASQSDLKAS